MRIAVNTRLIIKGRMDGIGWFTYETMRRLASMHPEDEFFFLFDRSPDPCFDFPENVKKVVVRPITRHPALIKIWNLISVPLVLRSIKPDLYISPDGFLPYRTPSPSIVIVHDLNFEHYPEFLPGHYHRLYSKWLRKATMDATRICTVSSFSRKDIMRCYGISGEKIDVVYCGLNSHIRVPNKRAIQEVQEKYGITGPYFIVTGSLHPRKNIPGVLEAYTLFRNAYPETVQMVFAGNNKWWSPAMEAAYSSNPYPTDIIFTGYVNNDDLNALTHGAMAMVFASLFEGFGIPILEAAAAGIPVITSGNSSMEEIAGGTAVLIDPGNPPEIADAMVTIARDEDLRKTLVLKSAVLNRKFSWDKTASLLSESIEKIVLRR